MRWLLACGIWFGAALALFIVPGRLEGPVLVAISSGHRLSLTDVSRHRGEEREPATDLVLRRYAARRASPTTSGGSPSACSSCLCTHSNS